MQEEPDPQGKGSRAGGQEPGHGFSPVGRAQRPPCPAMLSHVSCGMTGHTEEDQVTPRSGTPSCLKQQDQNEWWHHRPLPSRL